MDFGLSQLPPLEQPRNQGILSSPFIYNIYQQGVVVTMVVGRNLISSLSRSCRAAPWVQNTPAFRRGRPVGGDRTFPSFSSSSSSLSSLEEILELVSQGKLSPHDASTQMQQRLGTDQSSEKTPTDWNLVQSFAKIDHGRSKRTGFPEVIFAQDKTAEQVHAILDHMAKHNTLFNPEAGKEPDSSSRDSAILATR